MKNRASWPLIWACTNGVSPRMVTGMSGVRVILQGSAYAAVEARAATASHAQAGSGALFFTRVESHTRCVLGTPFLSSDYTSVVVAGRAGDHICQLR